MITISCDFWQFLAKKVAFFLYPMFQFLHISVVFLVKNVLFRQFFFGEKILKSQHRSQVPSLRVTLSKMQKSAAQKK
jgi:hypothetical protein